MKKKKVSIADILLAWEQAKDAVISGHVVKTDAGVFEPLNGVARPGMAGIMAASDGTATVTDRYGQVYEDLLLVVGMTNIIEAKSVIPKTVVGVAGYYPEF
jgi:hypothetical protein